MEGTKESYPAWIEWLFRSGIGLGCFDGEYALFRQRLARENIQSLIDAEPESLQLLRRSSLQELHSTDTHKIERALLYLMVVGRAADVAAVETLLRHPSEIVRKAAKTCRFELKKRWI